MNCPPEPALVAFLKTFGITFGFVSAALAWLLNRFLSWCVWEGGRILERYELMKIIHTEIADTQEVEVSYADDKNAREIIGTLNRKLPSDAPLIPYVAVDDRQFAFDDGTKEVRLLPLSSSRTGDPNCLDRFPAIGRKRYTGYIPARLESKRLGPIRPE